MANLQGGVTASIWICFFVSGAAGLIYEIVWTRMLGLVFGHTVFAVTTVLAAFMAGLALGAWLFGRLIDDQDRPLRVYAWLEIGVGLSALATPLLLQGAQNVYLWVYRAMGLSFFMLTLSQFLVAFCILLIPATLMGATLPVLGKFYVDELPGLGRKIGQLYAVNTFGAVAGSAAAGFFLLPAIGAQASIVLAVAFNLAVGVWCLAADRWLVGPRRSLTPQPSPIMASSGRALETGGSRLLIGIVLAGICFSGATSMLYEVAWTRALRLAIGSSIYAFSSMLTTFLVGLALGSFLFGRIWGRRPADAALFGWLEVAVGFSALALIPVFGLLPDVVLAILKQTSPSAAGALLAQVAVSFLAMIVPTTIIGATFPCAVQISARALPRLGRDVGQVYAANTAGTILGAALAGFLLIPWLGAETTMKAAAAVNLAVGAAVLTASSQAGPLWRRAAFVPLAALFVFGIGFLPRWDRRVMMGGASIYVKEFASEANPAARFRASAAARELLFYREGINSTVAVERGDRITALKVDGKVDASNGVDMMTQLMSGHLPVLLHTHPERVLIIGLGSGVTVGAVAQHPVVREIDVVEMEPAVIEASNFFARENRNALRDPRVRAVLGDGRNFLLAGEARYDIISSEPSNPWMAGVANLFSLEFYRLARSRLADDGIMVQWLHGYSLFPREFRMILNTFRRVFPHATLWRTMTGDYFLVGRSSPLVLDYALLQRRLAASATAREDIAALRFESPVDLLPLSLLDEADLARFAEGAPENTDDKPLLEFAAPLALYAETTELNSRSLSEARMADLPPVANLAADAVETRRLRFAQLYWARGEKEEALRQLAKAPLPAPGDSASRLERAKLLFSLGEIARATEDLDRIRPQTALIKSYLKAGDILRRIKAEEGITGHGRTRLGDPNPAEAFNNLGVFYTQLGIQFLETAFFDLAVDALDAALRIEPQGQAVLNNLANAYFELGRLDEAAATYRRLIGAMPDFAELRFNLGLVYEKQARVDLAAREFERAVTLKPQWAPPKIALERVRLKRLLAAEAGGGR